MPVRAGRWLCALLVVIAGCAGVPVADDEAERLASVVPPRIELDGLPFYPQEDYQCGPAALATVLSHAGREHTPAELVDQVYVPRRQGSFQAEMLAAARRAGLLAYVLPPEPEALYREVAAGHPPVVLLNLRFDFFPKWHYAVLAGYDLSNKEVVLRSGAERRAVMTMSEFGRAWGKAGRWAFVALPPDRLPAGAAEEPYVNAAVALERAAPDSARIAYATALTKWPHNLLARIGLGNAAYRRGDLAVAEAEYRLAVADHPEAADAWNNLAQVLHERGRGAEAVAAAERAVALGGPRQATYEATLASVKAGAAQ